MKDRLKRAKASSKKAREELITLTQVIINKGLRKKVSESAEVIKNQKENHEPCQFKP